MVKTNKWLVGVLVLLFVGAGAFVLFGTEFGRNLTDRDGNSTAVVCDSDVVERYNAAAKSIDSYDEDIEKIALDVEGMSDFRKDANCLFIVYKHYSYAQDVSKSRQLLDDMKKLAADGSVVHQDIADYRSLEEMEAYVSSMEQNRNRGDDIDGNG